MVRARDCRFWSCIMHQCYHHCWRERQNQRQQGVLTWHRSRSTTRLLLEARARPTALAAVVTHQPGLLWRESPAPPPLRPPSRSAPYLHCGRRRQPHNNDALQHDAHLGRPGGGPACASERVLDANCCWCRSKHSPRLVCRASIGGGLQRHRPPTDCVSVAARSNAPALQCLRATTHTLPNHATTHTSRNPDQLPVLLCLQQESISPCAPSHGVSPELASLVHLPAVSLGSPSRARQRGPRDLRHHHGAVRRPPLPLPCTAPARWVPYCKPR